MNSTSFFLFQWDCYGAIFAAWFRIKLKINKNQYTVLTKIEKKRIIGNGSIKDLTDEEPREREREVVQETCVCK